MLTHDQLTRDLSVRDLTDPAQGPHAIQLLIDDAVGALVDLWGCEMRIARGPRVVPLTDNYDALGFPHDVVTRDARYTRYVDDRSMLRSHSSAMIPAALRDLDADEDIDDVLLACPGIVYRRDAIDRLHTGTPHQLDLWRVTKRPMGEADLVEMIGALACALVPGATITVEPRVHPYTLAGRQVDADGVEIAECGIAHPDVVGARSGLALGMGLDRLLMLRKGIPDIRLLRSPDRRVAAQMQDLEPYRPVSDLPAVTRDLSIAVASGDDAELLGDRVRDALGDDAEVIESVEVVSETGWLQLPDVAVKRLGMDASQKNVLLRLVIRPHDRTLTDAGANRIRDRVYLTLHRGSVTTLAP